MSTVFPPLCWALCAWVVRAVVHRLRFFAFVFGCDAMRCDVFESRCSVLDARCSVVFADVGGARCRWRGSGTSAGRLRRLWFVPSHVSIPLFARSHLSVLHDMFITHEASLCI